MVNLDCFGSYEPQPYGCEFLPSMTESEYKEWVQKNVNENLTDEELEKLRTKCETCYKWWYMDEERLVGR